MTSAPVMQSQRCIGFARAVLAGALCCPLLVSSQVVPMTWSGTADWTSTTNWSPNGIPGATNIAQIGSGTVTVSDTRSVGAIALSGGTLTGAGSLTLSSGNSTWTGGAMSGAGTTTIGSGAILIVSGAADHDFNQRAIVNQGLFAWQGGRLRTGNGGSITNASGATFQDTASNVFNNDLGGTLGSFTNAAGATYSKSGAAGTTTMGLVFTNLGTMNISSGTFALTGDGSSIGVGSTVNLSAGAVFSFGSLTTANAPSLLGAGQYRLDADTLTLNGTFNGSSFLVAGGSLAGTHTFAAGTAAWTAGNWSNAGTTTIGSGVTLTVSTGADHDFNSRAIVNQGTFTWQGGRLRTGNAGSITIASGGAFNDSASTAINNDLGGTTGTFVNATGGTYNKTAAGTTTIALPFTNNGALNVQAGTLDLSGDGGALNGTVLVSGGAILHFSGAISANAPSLTGPGTYQLISDTLTLSGVFGGSVFNVIGGTLAGTHTFNSGAVGWSNGNWNTTGTTTIGSGVTFTVTTAADHDFNSRAIINQGTFAWQTGRLRTGNAGSITNASGGVFNDSASNAINNDYGGTIGSFTNAAGGTYNKTAAGTTTISIPFTNSGTLNVQAGALDLTGDGGAISGTVAVNAAATLNFGGTISASAPSLTGTGAYQLVSDTLTLSGAFNASTFNITGGSLAGTHTFAAGAVGWSNGNWNNTGTTTIGSGVTLTVSGAPDHDFNARAIINQGTFAWQDGRLRTGNSGSITNASGGIFHDSASNAINNDYGGTTGSFTNAVGGTYNKTAAGTTSIGIPFTNAGTLNVQAGTLALNGDGSSIAAGSTVTVSSGATLSFNSVVTANAPSLAGAGTYQLVGDTLTLNGAFNASVFTVTGGTLAGTHTFAGGAIGWTGGNFNSSGTTTIGTGVTFTVSASTDHDFNSRALVNQGTFAWTAGDLRTGNSGSITNASGAVFSDAASANIGNNYGGTMGAFTNASGATYNKTAAGTTTHGLPFNNSGVVNLNSGILAFAAGGSATVGSTFNVTPSDNLRFAGGTFTIDNGSVLVGTGAVSVTGGVVNVSAGSLEPAAISISGGTLGGAGSLQTSGLVLSGGSLAAPFLLTGSSSWTGGNLNGAALGTIGSGVTLAINTASDKDLSSRTLVNNGTVNWNGGTIRLGNSAVITNQGAWNDFADAGLNAALGGPGSFTNATGATFTKHTGGTTSFGIPLTNAGTMNVQLGTLDLTGTGSSAVGSLFSVSSGATLRFNSNFSIANAASLTGAGIYQLAGGTLDLSGTFTPATFNITGGGLTGTHTLAGPTTWSGGNWNGAGTTTIGSGSTVTISGGLDHDFNARAIVTQGTLEWTGGVLRSGTGGSITLSSGGLLRDTASQQINGAYGGSVTLVTSPGGTYRKEGPAGTTTLSVPLQNDGTVEVNTGTLSINAGGSSAASGVFTLASGSTLQFSAGTFTQNSPGSINGPSANYVVSGGTWSIGAGALTLPNLTIAGGTLTGAVSLTTPSLTMSGGALAPDFTLTGAASWTGGNWNAAALAAIGTGATLTIGSGVDHDFNARTLNNSGTINWTGGALRSGNSGQLNNAASGIFNDTASSSINAAYGGTLTINNAGLWNKNAAGTSTFSVPFINTGTLAINTGTMSIAGGGSSALGSSITVGNGANLSFTGGTFTLANGSVISGASANYSLAGATLAISAGSLALPNFTFTGGTLSGLGSLTTPNLTQSGGSLGTDFTVTNLATWSGGNWNAGGATATIASGGTLTITTGFDHDFNARTIANSGTVNWQAGNLRGGNGSVFTNAAGGTFNDNTAAAINGAYGGAASFVNQGTYNKTVGGTTLLQVPFTNSGTLNVNAGTIDFSSGGSNALGAAINVGTGATLRLSGGTFTLADTANLTGASGFYALAGGTLVVGSGVLTVPNLAFSGGTLAGPGSLATPALNLTGGTLAAPFTLLGGTWTGGSLNGAATGTIATGGVLVVSGGSDKDFNQRTLVNDGTFSWQGGTLRTGNGGSFVNQSGGVFIDGHAGFMNAAYGGAASFINHGTYSKTVANTTQLQIPFVNHGTVSVLTGTLRFTNSFTQNAGTISLFNGTAQFDQGLTITSGLLGGAGTIVGNTTSQSMIAPGLVIPGQLTFNGSLTLASTSQLILELGGTNAGDFDTIVVSTGLTLGGALQLSFVNSFGTSVLASDTFTVATGATLAGTFANVANGQRLFTSDGVGSFQVNYGLSSAFATNSVVLSNFVAIPEPSTYVLLALGATGILWRFRRR